MNFIDSQIAALEQEMLEMHRSAGKGVMDSYNLLKSLMSDTPPPRGLSQLSVQELWDIDRNYRIAYFELSKISYKQSEIAQKSLLKIRDSKGKPTRGPSTAFITKGS